ncbi:MAG: 4-hydroxy-3-methylbut-2-enyl diphosphate reductase [Elusimicrobiota bacterium]|jgi:4-hydroxy-3-methylbut-2-enyl diphosphate reductase|nr:4-hydroxy-3-methylbut-2-enyl diphosphate reductase [Elusimicrobiota bacterium]
MRDKDQGVYVAPGAGFCPGVKKAIDRVLELEAAGKKPIYTIGPLIHNKQVSDNLEAKGITAIETPREARDKNGVLVIRAHGVTPNFQNEIEALGMQVIDATCPLVKKAHKVIEEYAAQGYDTVIIGDAGHAEVTGLLGYTRGRGAVAANAEEAGKLPRFAKVNVVAQTTQKEEIFYEAAEVIKAKAGVCRISNTICEPTKQRQRETIENAQTADFVIVVGGRHSANTARLSKLCGELCPKVMHVESAAEIRAEDIASPRKIFITAGASTPNWVIEEVAARVRNLRKRRISPPALIEAAWAFIIRSAVYASFASVCLAYVCVKLQNARADAGVFALAGFFVFTLTAFNREESVAYFKSKKYYFAAAVLGAAAVLAAAFRHNIYVWAPTLLFLAMGLAYPFRNKIKLLSALPGAKDILTALGWCFVCVYAPLAAQGAAFGKSSVLALAYGFLLVFTRSVILSIGAEYKDMMLGKESFYKAFGIKTTQAALTLIIIALSAVLAKLYFMGWKPKLVAFLLLGHAYTIGAAVYFYSRRIPRGTGMETIIDGQFYLLALLAYIGTNLI